ncbi:MAG TPA: hypothetical protein VHA78_05085 [Candidatus Peribacteraceae bacterium]|nr:hypothetical protein [Candidatus Peribacteraceae bacterium]
MERTDRDFPDIGSMQFRIAGMNILDPNTLQKGHEYVIARDAVSHIRSGTQEQLQDVAAYSLFVAPDCTMPDEAILRCYPDADPAAPIVGGGTLHVIDDMLLLRGDSHAFAAEHPEVRERFARMLRRKLRQLFRLPLKQIRIKSTERVNMYWLSLKRMIAHKFRHTDPRA